jgi:hypothetical protein
MATYSLLQVSLDQTIDRDALEDASVVVPSVARADCASMQRDLFGVLVSHLPLEEARIFQAELKRRGFPTDVVADHDLPTLHEAFTIQRIELQGNVLCFTDTVGRVQTRPREGLVFVAGGFLTQNRIKHSLIAMGDADMDRPEQQTSSPEFRLDFFFWSAPHRLRASISAESMMFFQQRPMRLRDTALLLGAMMDLQELLPRERVGAGLRRPDTKIFYPSLKSYEEEIRWHFYRLKTASPP